MKPCEAGHKTLRGRADNYFQALIIYFQGLKIYYHAVKIYYQALKITL